MATQPAPEPPVRLYKIIAVTFLVIAIGLIAAIIFITSKKVDIIIAAKADTEPITLSTQVTKDGANGTLKGVVTSTVFVWSETYHPTGNKQVSGIAKGTVTIYNKTNSSQPLVKTTRLLTPDNVMFRLSENTVVPANGQVAVSVYADQPGQTGDIGPSHFTIPGLPAEKQKVIYAESTQPMVGGVTTAGVLSSDDIKNAEDDYKQKIKDAFVSKYALNTADQSVQVMVGDQKLSLDHKVGDEVSDFTITGTNTMVIVTYATDDLKNAFDKQMQAKIDSSSEKLLSADTMPQVTVTNYSAANGTADLTVTENATVTLDADVEKLDKHYFFGKSKDEIERYVMSLDHVAGVEVQFTPSWVSTAPASPDHIRVIVKNAE